MRNRVPEEVLCRLVARQRRASAALPAGTFERQEIVAPELELRRIVETAQTDELFTKARHPYTQGLLRSIPRIDLAATEKQRLEPIPGTVPTLQQPALFDFSRFKQPLLKVGN